MGPPSVAIKTCSRVIACGAASPFRVGARVASLLPFSETKMMSASSFYISEMEMMLCLMVLHSWERDGIVS